MDFRGGLLGVAIVLALGAGGGMLASTVVASRAYTARGDQHKKSEQSLSVTGSAKRRIKSDLAVWRISVKGEGDDLKGAYSSLKNSFDKVSGFLASKKFADNEIAVGAIDTHTHYKRDDRGQETRTVSQYTLDRSMTVTSSRLDSVAAAAAEVTELIKDGVLVVSAAPEYIYTKLSDLKIQMIGEASKDARARAEQIALNAGCALTEVRNARMGVLQITTPNSTEVSDSGINDTTTIDKDVMSVVSLTIGLETR